MMICTLDFHPYQKFASDSFGSEALFLPIILSHWILEEMHGSCMMLPEPISVMLSEMTMRLVTLGYG
jgi:hypothetical protein